MPGRLSQDWERLYQHPIYFLETFVDPERFAGTCYRAANWMVVGKTTGRGKDSNSDLPNRSLKLVLVLPPLLFVWARTAARMTDGECLHLWFHPHNLGDRPAERVARLLSIYAAISDATGGRVTFSNMHDMTDGN